MQRRRRCCSSAFSRPLDFPSKSSPAGSGRATHSDRTTPLGVAIVGCGAIGHVHAAVASGLDAIRIVALVDPMTADADILAERLSAAGHPRPLTFESLDVALTLPEVALVVLATPSGLHVIEATKALEAGRHVFIEKPLDVDLRRARALVGLAESSAKDGLVTSIVSQHRFDPASRTVERALHDGAFGVVTSAIASTAWWRSQSYYDSADWRGTWLMDGGGALLNQAVHNVDLLLFFMGTPLEVSGSLSRVAHERIEVEDAAAAVLTFGSGAVAVLHATTAAYPGLTTRLQLMGSRGSAVIEDDELAYFHTSTEGDADVGVMGLRAEAGNRVATMPNPPTAETALGIQLPPVGPGQYRLDPMSLRLQYEDLIEAVTAHRPAMVTARDGFAALTLVRSVYVSETLRRPVLFEDVATGAHDDVAPTVRDNKEKPT